MGRGKFFIGFLLTVIIGIGLIMAINYIINPKSEFKTTFFQPLVRSARTQKVELLRDLNYSPQIVILGSSHVLNLDPELIQNLTNKRAFNAAVYFANTEELLAFVLYMKEDLGFLPEEIWVGLDIDSFHDNRKLDSRLLAEKRLYSKIKHTVLPPTFISLVSSLSPSYIFDDLRVVYYTFNGYPEQKINITKKGVLVRYDMDALKASGEFNIDKRINETMMDSFKNRFSGMGKLDEKRKEYFEKFLSVCKENDIELKIFITPLHKTLEEYFTENSKYQELLEDTRVYLSKLQKKYPFYWVDYSEVSSFFGAEDGFIDGDHVDEHNADLIVRELLSIDLKKGINLSALWGESLVI